MKGILRFVAARRGHPDATLNTARLVGPRGLRGLRGPPTDGIGGQYESPSFTAGIPGRHRRNRRCDDVPDARSPRRRRRRGRSASGEARGRHHRSRHAQPHRRPTYPGPGAGTEHRPGRRDEAIGIVGDRCQVRRRLPEARGAGHRLRPVRERLEVDGRAAGEEKGGRNINRQRPQALRAAFCGRRLRDTAPLRVAIFGFPEGRSAGRPLRLLIR